MGNGHCETAVYYRNFEWWKKTIFFGFIFMKLLFCGKKLPANLRKLEKSNIFFDRTWLAWPPFAWKREGSSQRKLQKKWNRQKSEFQIANGLPHEFFCGKKNPNEKIKIIFSQKKSGRLSTTFVQFHWNETEKNVNLPCPKITRVNRALWFTTSNFKIPTQQQLSVM